MSDVPKKIGRYQVERLLGQGAMGMVFLGRDPELDRPVAIKTVRDHGLSREQLDTFLARFKNEARAAAKLHHPSVVAVYDVGEDSEAGPYLVLEYVPGSSLKTILQSRGALEPAEAVAMGREVARAIDAAHAAGIVHRDIKPDNLLVTPDGRTKLADFGVARLPDAMLTREGQFLGTPCYAAPETLTAGAYGVPTDLFSFAAVLYEAISGSRAFPGDEALSVANKVIHDQPAPPSAVSRGPKIPAAVDDVIMAGLSKNPGDRYESATAFAEAVQHAYVDAGVVREEDLPSLAPAGPIQRGNESPARGWTLLAVVVGGLAVGIAAVLFVTGGHEEGVDAVLEDAGTGALVTTIATRPESTIGPVDGTPELTGTAEALSDAAIPIAENMQDESDAGSAANIATLDSFEREERAKDAIDDARRAMARSDVAAARAALALARRLDPENGDLRALEAQIEAGTTAP